MRRILKALGFGSLAMVMGWSTQTYASGYKVEFQSASTLADGGDAAVVEDAGTNWYNSAGLIDLHQQLAVSFIHLYEQTMFTGTSFAPSLTVPSFFGSGKASSYNNVELPGIHYALPFMDKFAFGVSLVPAWGLVQDYGDRSLVRYDLSRVYTRTIDIAPSFAYKFDCHWSLGLGPDFAYFTIQEKNHSRVTPVDSISRIVASNWGYGGHAGLLYHYDDATRVGLNYRSKIAQHLTGYSDFVLSGIASFQTNRFSVNLPHPPTTSLSIYRDVTPCFALMATVNWDQWSVIRDVHGINYIQPPVGALTSIYQPLDYSNTFDVGIGTKYKINDDLTLRGSIKYEQTPTRDKYRDLNFPDGEKLGFNFGARYQLVKKVALDFIYAHVFTRTVPMNITEPVTIVTTKGHLDNTIDLIGAQVVWDI